MNLSTPSQRFKTRLLTAVVVVTNVTGNILMSRGLHHVATLTPYSPSRFVHALAHPYVLAGVAILVIWMVCNLALLSRADLSYVLPVTASAYVFIALIGQFVLGEGISLLRWIAIVTITVGVMLVGETAPLTTRVRKFEDGQ